MGVLKKAVRGAKRFVKKRYNVGGKKKGGPNTGQIVKDVMSLMSMVNAEKKINNIGVIQSTVGQVSGASSSGTLSLDVTPMMAQGADQFQRNGISIKLHTQLYQIQLSQMTASTCANTFCFELWLNKGSVIDQATAVSQIYDPSVFSGIIDMTSSRNADHFNNYSLIRRVKKRLSDPSYAGDLTNSTFTVPIKFNRGKGHHIRYTGTGSTNYLTDVQSGQILLVCRADNGNRATASVSTLPVAIKASNTGINFTWAVKTWYYDN